MKKLPPSVKGVAFALALVAVAVAGYFLLIAPQRTKAADLERQIDDVRSQIALAQSGGVAGSPGTETTPIRVADLFRLSRAMPERPDIPNVLLQLSQIASETGITFQSITPHDPELLGTYRRLPIELVFQGHFYDLADFLYRLRNLVGVHDGQLDAIGRLFAVNSVAFEEGDLKFPQVRARLTVEAYVYGDGSAPADVVPPAAAGQAQTVTEPAASTTTEDGSEPIPPSPAGSTAAGR